MTPLPVLPHPERGAADAAALAAAFEAFNQVSRELESSYGNLERETERLRSELHLANRRKIEELVTRHRRLAALGEMAAALAHQIRTPLAAALLYTTNARRSELPTGQRDALLGKAIDCLHELERLIADMLGFARGATLAGQPFTLSEILDSVENSLRPFVPAGVTLDIARPPRDLRLSGNRETLASALLNLVTNALHSVGDAGHVRITARVAGPGAEIAVTDSGAGVPEPLREKIFEPFFTSRPDGTGLGLAVARSIARAHRGDVVLRDGGAGQTTFVLSIPAADPGAADAVDDRSAA